MNLHVKFTNKQIWCLNRIALFLCFGHLPSLQLTRQVGLRVSFLMITSLLDDSPASDRARHIQILRHVALVATDAGLAALSIALIPWTLVVIIEYFSSDDVYPFVTVNKVDVGLGPCPGNFLGLREATHVVSLVVLLLLDTEGILLLCGSLTSQNWLSSLKGLGYLREATGRETRVCLVADRIRTEDNGWSLELVRFAGWLWTRVLQQTKSMIVNFSQYEEKEPKLTL